MQITRLLAANRSEIAIRIFRSVHELGIRTVAMYAPEDRYSLHRFKADEAYQVGVPGKPIQAYLDIDAIIKLAKKNDIDAIHPGYGFLSENSDFAQACADAGMVFVGPRVETLTALGDKISARKIAQAAGVPVLGGSGAAIGDVAAGKKEAKKLGFPVILKAAYGGGGRGMRIVRDAAGFAAAFEQATREAHTAFGNPEVFVEKFVERARHIEVQLLGDQHGNLLHLYERDCSVQRRHQKVVEIAPAPNLDGELRRRMCEAAITIGRQVHYENAGTVEFLVDLDSDQYYFIEVNPRIQVEHTVTEETTQIDIVKAQVLIAQGTPLSDPQIGLPDQAAVTCSAYAIQCRVTTEDPANKFMPDYGRISAYRSVGGMGVRLDGGTAFTGAVVFPFYDSLLVKVTTRARRFDGAAARMERALQEFRIRGVKSNIPFLIKLITHPTFVAGECTTRFIDETPELFNFPKRKDRATKLLSYIGDVIVNGNPLVKGHAVATRRAAPPLPAVDETASPPAGMRQRLQSLGPAGLSQWIVQQKPLLMTDTTFRDAHQSLLATRLRTYDMLAITEAYAQHCPELFSLEMWGGATFDTAMRFLKESPWGRLAQMRQRVPNILFQMLLRASNAVGYTNYPDNVVRQFVRLAAEAGIDVFRVFDALNGVENMRIAMDAVLESGTVCEAAICYTGDLLDPQRPKYHLEYYVEMAKELEQAGAHIIAIKDMAGLCKPQAARTLIEALKDAVGVPIHFHTHDTAGVQAASIIAGSEVGLDIADAAMAPMSGGTSQPNLNTVVEALRFSGRDTGLSAHRLDAIAEYWRAAREFYAPFESPTLPAGADLYRHEMPGGQYTNLFHQAKALGLADRWAEVCRVYADVNQLFGDIVKVTPTSKAVGDMALFLIANEMSVDDVLGAKKEVAYPQSVIDLLSGRMGMPPDGFPEAVVRRVLKEEKPLKGRPGATLPGADFTATAATLAKTQATEPSSHDVISSLLYSKVYAEYAAHRDTFSDTSVLPTPVFLFGMPPREEIAVEIERGKTLIIKFLAVGEPREDGHRTVFFELNGQPREVEVVDRSLEDATAARPKADPANKAHVGSTMPGMVVNVAVNPGDKVVKGQKLVVLEAMKMQSTLTAERNGVIAAVEVTAGVQVGVGDLLMVFES